MIFNPLVVPETPTFEQAIALTQALLDQVEQAAVSATEITAIVTALIQTTNGARGFFVTYSTDSRPQATWLTAAVVAALESGSAIASELLVKNLAMSTAMILTHQRQQNPEMAENSARVQTRTIELIQQLNSPAVGEQGQQLRQGLTQGEGNYAAFLKRWGYDQEQLQAIEEILVATFQATGMTP